MVPLTKRLPRCGGADVLKAIAICSALLIHTSYAGYGNPVGSFNWYAAIIWGTLPRACVPIFCMVSGALMLDPARSLSLQKLWTHYIPRLLASLLVWSYSYHIYRLIFVDHEGFTLQGLIQSLKLTLTFQYEFHLYFLHIILLVYILLPLTRLVTAKGDRKTQEYLLVIWAVLAILYPTLQDVWPVTLLSPIFDRVAINSTYACVGYGLLGWYLRQYAAKTKKWMIFFLTGFLLSLASVILPSLAAGVMIEGKLNGTDLGVSLMGIGICGWAFSYFRRKHAPNIALLLSKASFCIYLVHIYFLYGFRNLGFDGNTGPCILFVPLTALVILVCSLVVWRILSHIPVVQDWLI